VTGNVSAIQKNWAGNIAFSARRFAEPASVEELQHEVASAAKVRAVGSRHSFNRIADSPDTMISVRGIDANPVLDKQARTLTIGAGATYGEAARFLQTHGWALHNMGSLPHISIGGAISTGTHGSGIANGSLSTAVCGLELVTAAGELLTVTRGDEHFEDMVVGLGMFGVLHRVILDIQRTYDVRQDVYKNIPWSLFLRDVGAVMGAAYSVSVFTGWGGDTIDQVWLKSRAPGDTPDASYPDEVLGQPRDLSASPMIGDSIEGNITEHGSMGPWLDRLPHFRIDTTPSKGDEFQSEYFIDLADAAGALNAVRQLADQISPLLVVTELRTVAADRLSLSPAFERDSLAIHFTWAPNEVVVARVVALIEDALSPFQARPHWGKVHSVSADTLAGLYPRMDDVCRLAIELDPQGKFRNEHLDRLLFP
jgi:alditol oxidase